MDRAVSASKAGRDTYFACAEYKTPDNRKATNAAGACAFWVDIDVDAQKAAKGKGYETLEDAKLALAEFCLHAGLPMPTHLVASGGGLHAYWVLDAFIDHDMWTSCAAKLKALTNALGFLADDSRTGDIASVLRVPGTLNHKYNPPREVTLEQAAQTFIAKDEMLAAIDSAHGQLGKPVQAQVKLLIDNAGDAARVQRETFGPPDVQRLASALAVQDPDCDDYTWTFEVIAPMARAARGYPELAGELRQLAVSFSSGELRGKPSTAWATPGTNNKLTGAQAFNGQWLRFLMEPPSDQNRTGLGTIYHNAKQFGWVDSAKLPGTRATSEFAHALNAEHDSAAAGIAVAAKREKP